MEPLTLAIGRASRRQFCLTAAMSPLAFLAGSQLARADGAARAKSLIVLWLDGGPSQLETFDPHPGTEIGGPTGAIETAATGVRLSANLPLLAREMKSVTLVRSLMSKEGDHERGRYNLKTGYRLNPSVVHPALGAICSAELPAGDTQLPRYVQILGRDPQSKGGYLGEAHDPFHIDDPADPVPDLRAPVEDDRLKRRIANLEVIEGALAGRNRKLETRTEHLGQVRRALRVMQSSQLKAFKVDEEPAAVRERYGNTPFGRGCLAARRLVEAGVPCIEVQLGGWDSHARNFEVHKNLCATLDPAFAALVADLRDRGMLDSTLVLCMGEFGRTPQINGVGGRDHWPTGFAAAIAGGGVQGGRAIGVTDPAGKP
ncbi:MAG TPA: DUF1501 domain-containing protein, partial [Planctomycetia bacterium]|nr:DUF1501 domain-containing protein [Planctomycetia bacterium]